MRTIPLSEAKINFTELVNEVIKSNEPMLISSEIGNTILTSEQKWKSILETLYLLTVPSMRKSIKQGLAEDEGGCSRDLDW